MSIEPVRKNVLVRAAPERAFAVFTAGAWWPKEHSILASGSPRREIVIEPRAGGRWYEVGEDRTECDWGRVLVWEPPRRMILGWQINGNFEFDPSATTEVEVNFIPEGEGTRVGLEHRGFELYATGQDLRDAVGGDNGWAGLLKLLATKIESAPPAEAMSGTSPIQYFVCKLIPPRPTFMDDMSEAEGKALGAHIGYWTALLEKKSVLIFGPVSDPTGVWGLGVLTASDEAEARKIAQDDPVITSGLGFKCEVYPMLRAVVA